MTVRDPGFGTGPRGPLKTMRADLAPMELDEKPPALPAAPPLMPRAKANWGENKRTTAKIEAKYSLYLARFISAFRYLLLVSSNLDDPLDSLPSSLRYHRRPIR